MLSPLQCPAVAWWRVHSRDGSQQAVHMRLHIYGILCSAQLSNAILPGFAFSCRTIHPSCHVQGHNDTYAQFSAATCVGHTQLSHYFRLFKLETQSYTKSVFPKTTATQCMTHRRSRTRGVVCGCRQCASV